MLIKEFHDEAVAIEPTLQSVSTRPVEIGSDRATRSTAVSLLIRLLLNGWITDKEKVFLDNLPPSDCLTFLMSSRGYIHPEGLELFPREVVEGATMQAGEAIFSHRYHPGGVSGEGQPYRIFSAAINPCNEDKIVLGFFGPEHRLGNFDEDNHFAKLVYCFREAHASVGREISKLRDYLERDDATVLINRSTGKVLTLNRVAAQILQRSERALVDIGLDQFRYHLLPLLSRYNIRMDNITASTLGVSVLTFETIVSEGDADILNYFANDVNSCVSSLTAAAGELRQTASSVSQADVNELAETVLSETGRIRTVLSQFNLFLNFDSLERVSQSLKDEVSKVVSGLPSKLLEKNPVVIHSDETELSIEAPAGAFGTLFEELLTPHLRLSAEGTETKVMMHSPNNTEYCIRLESRLPINSREDDTTGTSSTFIRQMAGKLGIDPGKCLAIEGNQLVTEITVKR